MVVKKNEKSKKKREVAVGRIYIQSTFNNTIITVTDSFGNALSSSTAGSLGFKGARKTTPYAAHLAMQTAVEKAKTNYNLRQVSLFVCGTVGSGREASVKALNNSGLTITSIKDITPVPHNGCRPKKLRRV